MPTPADTRTALPPPCTGDLTPQTVPHVLADLPCGCQDVHYADGTRCYEHNHVQCDGHTTGREANR